MISGLMRKLGPLKTTGVITSFSIVSSAILYIALSYALGKFTVTGIFMSTLIPALVAPVIAYSFLRVVHQRDIMADALHEREKDYRYLVENAQDIIYRAELGGRLVVFNPITCMITGYTEQELKKKHYQDLIHPDYRDAIAAFFRRQYQDKVPSTHKEFPLIAKDGTEVWVEQITQLMEDDRFKGFHAVARDITARRRVEMDLKEAKADAESASKAKSEFLANMSHELRTPLNHIMGFTELIMDRRVGEINDVQKEYLSHVLQSSHDLLSLIEDILDLSKLERGKLDLEISPVNLRMLLEKSMKAASERAARHKIRLTLKADDAPHSIRADERKLKQVLYNLLSNALKFTADGGRVEVVVRKAGRSNDSFGKMHENAGTQAVQDVTDRENESGMGTKDSVEFIVSDNGIGMKSEDLERIFDRFEKVDGSINKKYRGTGLGLALCKRLVELHKGAIWAESKGEGKGATFRFVIPA